MSQSMDLSLGREAATVDPRTGDQERLRHRPYVRDPTSTLRV
jgi:hypothetical protein